MYYSYYIQFRRDRGNTESIYFITALDRDEVRAFIMNEWLTARGEIYCLTPVAQPVIIDENLEWNV
jgi:hypothetical protein